GTALGDVYFFGAVGSIVGTFLAGFVLMYFARISTIVTVVAAALALLAAVLIDAPIGKIVGLLAAACLGLGSIDAVTRAVPVNGVALGSYAVHPITLVGHALALVLAVLGVVRLRAARLPAWLQPELEPGPEKAPEEGAKVGLGDLAALSFVASLAFMALEMVAG